MECFDFDRLPPLNRALVHDLATGRFVEEKVAILIVGPGGTGKSPLAQAIGHLVARQGHDVLFATQSQWLASLRQAQAVGTYERRFQTLVSVPPLLIDDFGLKPLRPPEDETFHALMAERHERAAAILTSTLDFGEWGEAFPANQLLGTATLDRLRHGAYRLILDDERYRSPKPRPPSQPPRCPRRKNHPCLRSVRTPDFDTFWWRLRRKSLAPLHRKLIRGDWRGVDIIRAHAHRYLLRRIADPTRRD